MQKTDFEFVGHTQLTDLINLNDKMILLSMSALLNLFFGSQLLGH